MVWTKNLLAALFVALAAPPVPAAPVPDRIFCCEGNRFCSDSLPPQCRGKAYRILDKSGNVLEEVASPLSPEQKAEAAAAAQRKKDHETQLKEQRRKDQALLDSYASMQDIELAQGKAEADVNLAIRSAEERIAVTRKQRQKFENEAEFYKNKALPADVAKGLRSADLDIKTQQELITVKKAELATIKAKYDGDRKRYGELTGRPIATPTPANPPAAAAPR